jgi:hypothetical protein
MSLLHPDPKTDCTSLQQALFSTKTHNQLEEETSKKYTEQRRERNTQI